MGDSINYANSGEISYRGRVGGKNKLSNTPREDGREE